MYFERKELIQSLDLLCFILLVYTWLLDNHTLLLVIKAHIQLQLCNPTLLHPTWSLPTLLLSSLSLSLLLSLPHLLFPPSTSHKSPAILIDFISESNPPSALHLLLIDLLLSTVQTLLLIIAFHTAIDQSKPDSHPSFLDDLDTLDQVWTPPDEEACIFGLPPHAHQQHNPRHTSLTHHIAVVNITPIVDEFSRRFLPQPHPSFT